MELQLQRQLRLSNAIGQYAHLVDAQIGGVAVLLCADEAADGGSRSSYAMCLSGRTVGLTVKTTIFSCT